MSAPWYAILDSHREGPHLVLRLAFPDREANGYDGAEIVVFLDTPSAKARDWNDVALEFTPRPDRTVNQAPPPDARFPASEEGWHCALVFVRAMLRCACGQASAGTLRGKPACTPFLDSNGVAHVPPGTPISPA